tara:strand:- start:1413 stop:2036 length:624 start_codon:yes stop_codon:yes gene_type:complete
MSRFNILDPKYGDFEEIAEVWLQLYEDTIKERVKGDLKAQCYFPIQGTGEGSRWILRRQKKQYTWESTVNVPPTAADLRKQRECARNEQWIASWLDWKNLLPHQWMALNKTDRIFMRQYKPAALGGPTAREHDDPPPGCSFHLGATAESELLLRQSATDRLRHVFRERNDAVREERMVLLLALRRVTDVLDSNVIKKIAREAELWWF